MPTAFRGALLLGTRSSALALWQTDHVCRRLMEVSPSLAVRAVPLSTLGDREVDAVLSDLGGAAFSSEIDRALLDGRVGVAVHSLKDLPIKDNTGIVTAAVLSRDDPRDALVSTLEGGLASLPSGAKIGTSSPRRRAQVLAFRNDLLVEPVRGNVETRIAKAIKGPLDAVVLAAAGLNRLGRVEHIKELLSIETFVPAPGQGALAVQCREHDHEARALLALIDEPAVRSEVDAERAFLSALGGGCSLPVGALARHIDGAPLELHGFVGALNGGESIRISASGEDPLELGRALAEQAISLGARELLA
ncbi:MAG TPA: hydroxymethylbilane synthase [Gemmatimonadetes bacterium]|nr:hydroxymethylbilane synthase [Gemmatimonadota bacterium]